MSAAQLIRRYLKGFEKANLKEPKFKMRFDGTHYIVTSDKKYTREQIERICEKFENRIEKRKIK